jgi:serine/threonine-protein kinase HipA
VLLHGMPVGWLEREGREQPTFTYVPEYVRTGRVPLSLRLPIGSQTYPAKRVQPYLRGLLPENLGTRQQWAQSLGTDSEDTFGILAQMGWDCPGAVQFCDEDELGRLLERAGEHEPVSDAGIAQRIRDLSDAPATWTMPGEHWSLGGQQEKFALASLGGRWFVAHGSAATTHIFKPGIKVLKHQALVEHVTMRAAAKLGVEIAESRMIGFEDQWAIVVERFDRVVDGTSIRRVHQEDMCQAVGRMPENKYESNGGPRLSDLAKLIRSDMTAVPDDIRALADFAVINVVTGAPDGHSKNISALLYANGERSVAPLYDLATGLAYAQNNVDRSVALSIGSERHVSRIMTKQWAKAAGVLGLDSGELIDRVAFLAAGFPDAFRDALDEVRGVPGAAEVSERSLGDVARHCKVILANL